MSSSIHTLTTFRYDPATNAYPTRSADRALGHNEVLIKTTHAGICYTDVHAKPKGCGLGHEGVGRVVRVGTGVREIKPGDRVGWGWLHHSCGHCTVCLDGYRQYCADARGFAFGELDQGAFGDYAIWDETFVYLIPDEISSAAAAPLMCAGASTYEALMAADTKPSDRVGVVGLGGLGHMAILFARAMGCAVTAFSRSGEKQQDALALGADEFVDPQKAASSGNAERANVNVLLLCANAVPDLEGYLPRLARMARIVIMTIQTEPLRVPYMPFVLPGHRLIASTEASRRNHSDMLRFVAHHKIQPWIQTFPLTEQGVADAFATLERGEMRFRGVLVAEGAEEEERKTQQQEQ